MNEWSMARFCVLTAPFLHHTLEYGLDCIAANGFSSIELWGASPHYCLDDYDSASRAHAVRGINSMLAARGLTMAVYHPEQVRQYPVNIASPSAYIRKKSLDFMRRSRVRFAHGTAGKNAAIRLPTGRRPFLSIQPQILCGT